MKKEKTLTILTIVLILSNLLDTFLTLKYIKFGPLDEGNPIMAYLLQGDGCLFAFVGSNFYLCHNFFLYFAYIVVVISDFTHLEN